MLYEHLVTLGTEIRLFWRRKITGASILFFVNRYMMLLHNLLSLRLYSPFTGNSVSMIAFASPPSRLTEFTGVCLLRNDLGASSSLTPCSDSRCSQYIFTHKTFALLDYIPWGGNYIL